MTAQLKSTGFAALAFSVSLGLVGLTVAQPAAASPNEYRVTAPTDDVVLRKDVSIRDLDLANPADQHRLDFRIRAASRFVCAPLSNGELTPAEKKCRITAKRSTDQQVAQLIERAARMAAAGTPSRFDATLAVVAPDAE